MSHKTLPATASLIQLKHQAKDLLHTFRTHDPASYGRIRDFLPALAGAPDDRIAAYPFALHDAQSVIAREYGSVSWAKLRTRVGQIEQAGGSRLAEECFHAIGRGDRAAVLSCFDRGLDINDRTFHGNAPITAAAYNNRLDLIELFVELGADINGLGYANGTAIMLAAWDNRPEAIRLLVRLGADIHRIKPSSGETALHWAALTNTNDASVRTLIELGADVNAPTRTGLPGDEIVEDGETFVYQGGETPLHMACFPWKGNDKTAIVTALLDAGADAQARTVSKKDGEVSSGLVIPYVAFDGETPLEWADKAPAG